MVSIATVNVNGVRAAQRKGMAGWLAKAAPAIVCLQEVRAPDEPLVTALPGREIHHDECLIKGRAGVAIGTALTMTQRRVGLGLAGDVNTGRWVEADVEIPTWERPLTVVSAYVHTGELGTEKQEAKHAFLAAMTRRLGELGSDPEALAVVCGDINVAHTERDIRNWRGNVGKRGFTEQERAHLTTWFDELGWVDVGRRLAGDVDGPYTWWSWRGGAFDRDVGWRIDYHLATPSLASLARSARVDRAASWDMRWSDHAPLVVDYR
ncbi:MAG: exodeoxyribonuclease III [Micrococcales bacterium]|nr:exodeoxyribonuclease III [Micrococcales bacterium]